VKTPQIHRDFTVKTPQFHRDFTVKTPQIHRDFTAKTRCFLRCPHGENPFHALET